MLVGKKRCIVDCKLLQITSATRFTLTPIDPKFSSHFAMLSSTAIVVSLMLSSWSVKLSILFIYSCCILSTGIAFLPNGIAFLPTGVAYLTAAIAYLPTGIAYLPAGIAYSLTAIA